MTKEESPKSRQEKNKKEKISLLQLWKTRRRKVPIIIRLLLALIFFVISLALGLMVGYGILGNGEMMDVFEKETWQHIIDIVKLEK